MIPEKIKELSAPVQIIIVIAIAITSIIIITNITVMASQSNETCRENIQIELTGPQTICKTETEQQKTLQLTIENTGRTKINALSILVLSNTGAINQEKDILTKTLNPAETTKITYPYKINNIIYAQIIPGFENGNNPITCYDKAIKETTIRNC